MSTLVRFFMDKKVNKNGATLVFSTHYSEILDEFKKSEVYDSDFLKGTVPAYKSYIDLKKVLISMK